MIGYLVLGLEVLWRSGASIILSFVDLVTVTLFLTLTLWWSCRELLRQPEVKPQRKRYIRRMNMKEVQVPFSLKLEETSRTQVKVSLSSLVPYRFFIFWGVLIKEMHLRLREPWDDLMTAVECGSLLEDCYQELGCSLKKTSHDQEMLTIQQPSKKLELGSRPRHSYPLVILMFPERQQPMPTAALISAIHVADDECALPTCILSQYIKESNGQMSPLRTLYLPNGRSSSGSGSSLSQVEQLCVVCQVVPVSTALIPCRHTCICYTCFMQLDTCPLCRTAIQSYFLVSEEKVDKMTGPDRSWLNLLREEN